MLDRHSQISVWAFFPFALQLATSNAGKVDSIERSSHRIEASRIDAVAIC